MVAAMQRHGASPCIDDINRLIEKSRLGYEECSDASGGYKDLRKEVKNLHQALRDLKQEFKDPASEVNRDRSRYGSELASIVSECNTTLDSLLALIDEYFKRKNVDTENLRLRQADLDQIGNVRVRLISCKMWVEGVLEKIEKEERRNEGRSSRDEKLLGELAYKMDKIADGVACSGESSAFADDMEEMWRLFEDKLIAQGVSHDDLAKYGSNLRRHLRNLHESGRLSRNSNSSRRRQEPLSINTSQWLDGIYTPPLSIDTINSASTDTSIKELGSREENIKFPQAMKSQRAMPGSGRSETNDNFRVGSWNSNGTADSGYALAMVRVPEPEITTTDMILRDDFASERKEPARLLGAPPVRENGRPRRASDEVVVGGSPTMASPIGSARSSISVTSPEAYRPRLAGSGPGLRPDSQDGNAYGTSPRTSGTSLFGSSPTPNISGGMYGHSAQPSLSSMAGRSSFSNGSDNGSDVSKTSTLQPDQAGRPIPANAQWTKVNRRLISPEVLNGGAYRYEARENYVAILGVLSREQLQVLAERTLQVRASRSRRSRDARPSDNRPTSRGSNDSTPTPATFSQPPSGPSAFPGVPAQTQQTPAKKEPVLLKPILKNANKSVRFDDDDLKGSDVETSETSTSYTTDSDTESSSDRRRIDPRDSRRPRSDRDRDRDRDSRRDRERDDRHRSAPMGHGRAQPMPINQPRQDQYMAVPSSGHGGGRRGSWENESRGSSYGSRDLTPRDAQTPRNGGGGNGNGNNGWSQKLTAGSIGAAAGTVLSLATDLLLDGLI